MRPSAHEFTTVETQCSLRLDCPRCWAARSTESSRGLPHELRALRVCDVDYPAVTTIRVERGYDDVEGPIEPKSQKGKRVVPVAGELRRYLLAHKLATGRDGDELLFGRTARAPFTPTHVRKRARQAWAAAVVGAFLRGQPLDVELKPLGLHEARHTYVSLMHAAGCSLEEVFADREQIGPHCALRERSRTVERARGMRCLIHPLCYRPLALAS